MNISACSTAYGTMKAAFRMYRRSNRIHIGCLPGKPRELIYFMTLYNIFSEFLEDISEDVLPNEATGFKTALSGTNCTAFRKTPPWQSLIAGAIQRLHLADSVGLGKTFTALAVIKYYENRNKNVLVLCPKS